MPATRSTRRRLAALGCAAALIVPVAGVLAGCGGSDDSGGVAQAEEGTGTSSGTATTASVDRNQALLDIAACMREQGVDFPDPTADENGDLQFDLDSLRNVDQEELRRGQEGCQEEFEAAQGVLGGDQTEQNDRLLEVAQCLRDQGLDVKDPQPGEFGPDALGIDPNDPDAQAAIEACQDVIGDIGPGGGN